MRQQVEAIIGQGQQAPSGHIPFTPRAKKVLELSLREALQLGHNYIGTEHILLGLVRENEGVAARILADFDADSEKIRNEIIRMLSGPGRRQGQGGGGSGSGAQAGDKKNSKLLDQSAATSPSWPPTASWTRSWGASARSSASCRSSPAAPRTPGPHRRAGVARPPWWRVLRSASRRGRCPSCCAASRSTARPGRAGGRFEVPR